MTVFFHITSVTLVTFYSVADSGVFEGRVPRPTLDPLDPLIGVWDIYFRLFLSGVGPCGNWQETP